MEETVIKDFVTQLLADAGVDDSDRALYGQLHEALEERVVTRLVLELVHGLTPEAATRLQAAFAESAPDPEAIFRKFGEEGVITAEMILDILVQLRTELLEELNRML